MTINAVKIQKNVKSYLLSKIDQWYTEKLAYVTLVKLQNDNNKVEK